MPTLLAAAGVPDVKEKLMQGYQANGGTFKGEAKKGPREEILYFSQFGELNAIRWNDWKANFAGEEGNVMNGTRKVTSWPLLVNLGADPYEQGSRSPEATTADREYPGPEQLNHQLSAPLTIKPSVE